MKINISTFNVRGLNDIYKREVLLNNFIKNKIDVLAIQDRCFGYTRNAPERYRISNISSKG